MACAWLHVSLSVSGDLGWSWGSWGWSCDTVCSLVAHRPRGRCSGRWRPYAGLCLVEQKLALEVGGLHLDLLQYSSTELNCILVGVDALPVRPVLFEHAREVDALAHPELDRLAAIATLALLGVGLAPRQDVDPDLNLVDELVG